jgi:hypothetical protein
MIGALLLVLGVGCGGGTTPPTQEALEARCKAYWQLRQKGDWGSVYAYLVSEERKFVPRDQFVNDRSKQLSFREYQVISSEVNGNQGTTKVKCIWRVNVPGDSQPYREGETTLKEYWLYSEGNWYLQMLKPPVG